MCCSLIIVWNLHHWILYIFSNFQFQSKMYLMMMSIIILSSSLSMKCEPWAIFSPICNSVVGWWLKLFQFSLSKKKKTKNVFYNKNNKNINIWQGLSFLIQAYQELVSSNHKRKNRHALRYPKTSSSTSLLFHIQKVTMKNKKTWIKGEQFHHKMSVGKTYKPCMHVEIKKTSRQTARANKKKDGKR